MHESEVFFQQNTLFQRICGQKNSTIKILFIRKAYVVFYCDPAPLINLLKLCSKSSHLQLKIPEPSFQNLILQNRLIKFIYSSCNEAKGTANLSAGSASRTELQTKALFKLQDHCT